MEIKKWIFRKFGANLKVVQKFFGKSFVAVQKPFGNGSNPI
jgi:hypothetical protein